MIALAGLVLIMVLVLGKRKPVRLHGSLSPSLRNLLETEVEFYRKLNEAQKKQFEARMLVFLASTRITGVQTEVEDIDRVLIAAGAIIPIFYFPDWEYINLNEVLLYPGAFNHDFQQEGQDRHIAGMVGDGAFEDIMILSKDELRQGFKNKAGKTNTAIHEFIHLIDKTDGSVDGIPESLLNRQYVIPWLQLMRRKVRQIMQNRSDIDPYGATNEAEFFAVASEYFFERPDLLQEKHPELFNLLATIFRQSPTREQEDKI
jgi:MtfA peptidase